MERGRWESQNFQLGSSAPGRRRRVTVTWNRCLTFSRTVTMNPWKQKCSPVRVFISTGQETGWALYNRKFFFLYQESNSSSVFAACSFGTIYTELSLLLLLNGRWGSEYDLWWHQCYTIITCRWINTIDKTWSQICNFIVTWLLLCYRMICQVTITVCIRRTIWWL